MEINKQMDIYKEMLQISTDVIPKRDLKKIAKNNTITKKTLLKILEERGYMYDKKSKGYICIKSATKAVEVESATLEHMLNNLVKMQLEISNNLLNKSHIEDEKSHHEKDKILEVEVKPLPQEDWEYKKKSIKVDDRVWESYVKVCESKYKGLKRQELTTIVLDKFIRENQ